MPMLFSSSWSGESSALGGFTNTCSGIGGTSPAISACRLRQRATANTSVLYRPPIGANAPAVSPYSVEYPIMASLLLPVFTSIQPYAFDSAMRHTMRQRACVFSAANPASLPPHASASAASNARYGSAMETVRVRIPRLRARSSASSTEWSVEYGPGISTPCTRSAPSASAHITATKLESMPPDNPMTTSENPASSMKPLSAFTQRRYRSLFSTTPSSSIIISQIHQCQREAPRCPRSPRFASCAARSASPFREACFRT